MGTGTNARSDEPVAAHSATGFSSPAGVAASPPARRRSLAWPTLGLLVLATVVAIIASVIVQLVACSCPRRSRHRPGAR